MVTDLASVTSFAVHTLSQETDTISFKKDADEIRKRFEHQIEVIKNVSMLISDRRKAHIQQFMQTEMNMNEAEQVKTAILALLREQHEMDGSRSSQADEANRFKYAKIWYV